MMDTGYIVIGFIESSHGVVETQWLVKGFTSLELAQKYIDKLSLDLLDSRDYMSMQIEETGRGQLTNQENDNLVERFIFKYGQMVFGGMNVILDCEYPSYRVERISFNDDLFDAEKKDKPITKRNEIDED